MDTNSFIPPEIRATTTLESEIRPRCPEALANIVHAIVTTLCSQPQVNEAGTYVTFTMTAAIRHQMIELLQQLQPEERIALRNGFVHSPLAECYNMADTAVDIRRFTSDTAELFLRSGALPCVLEDQLFAARDAIICNAQNTAFFPARETFAYANRYAPIDPDTAQPVINAQRMIALNNHPRAGEDIRHFANSQGELLENAVTTLFRMSEEFVPCTPSAFGTKANDKLSTQDLEDLRAHLHWNCIFGVLVHERCAHIARTKGYYTPHDAELQYEIARGLIDALSIRYILRRFPALCQPIDSVQEKIKTLPLFSQLCDVVHACLETGRVVCKREHIDEHILFTTPQTTTSRTFLQLHMGSCAAIVQSLQSLFGLQGIPLRDEVSTHSTARETLECDTASVPPISMHEISITESDNLATALHTMECPRFSRGIEAYLTTSPLPHTRELYGIRAQVALHHDRGLPCLTTASYVPISALLMSDASGAEQIHAVSRYLRDTMPFLAQNFVSSIEGASWYPKLREHLQDITQLHCIQCTWMDDDSHVTMCLLPRKQAQLLVTEDNIETPTEEDLQLFHSAGIPVPSTDPVLIIVYINPGDDDEHEDAPTPPDTPETTEDAPSVFHRMLQRA